jgi:hypothetical protein
MAVLIQRPSLVYYTFPPENGESTLSTLSKII